MIGNLSGSAKKEVFRQQRRKRSDLLLKLGLALEFVGVAVLVLAFGPIRGANLSDNTLEQVVTDLGIIITTAGMLLSLAGTIGGVYYAPSKIRQYSYLLALIGAITQLTGFAWDNILHVTGHNHFDEAHNAAIGGLILLMLASLFLAINARLAGRVNDPV